ncbi:MAG: hypothetical protein Kow00127_21890 [Bacteroidales bacterium]
MRPGIGKRSGYNSRENQEKPAAVEFIEQNTRKSISLRHEYLILEDVRTALNIYHLENGLRLRKELIRRLKSGATFQDIIQELDEAAEHARHLLQKKYRITK